MPDRIAVVAAHPDDEILGCGGTMARLAREGHKVHVLLLADGEGARDAKGAADAALVAARAGAATAANRIVGAASVKTLALPDNRMDKLELLAVVKVIEAFLEEHRPATVFTHHGGDVNIDHRIVHEAVVVATRPVPGQAVKNLLFFEVPSSTEWRPASSAEPFVPNWFEDISTTVDTKIAALAPYAREMRPFPHARSVEAVRALATWRGATAGVAAAEAFILGRRVP